MSPFDARAVRHAFGRAASTYTQAAALQREVESRLLEQLGYLDDRVPARVLDLGSGPGSAAAALKARWGRKSDVVAMDLALPMLREARAKSRFWRPIHTVQGDAQALPFADAAFDLVFSNLCLQWVADLPRALAELRRVMREGGLLLFSTFGPATLIELREAYAQNALPPPLSAFAAIQQVGDALIAQGFRNPVIERDTYTLTYADTPALMRELKAIGATDARPDRPRGLSGRSRHRAVAAAYEAQRRDGLLPSTWEVVTAMAWAPPPGAARREHGVDIATFPADRLTIRKR
ncbi:MAG TPA: malonyl-[acyl-carrier protein] O-methyltransferase BioC [Xanthomonadaceae bacterium]|jgi:malonyl-CoA O-methyltransferase|nr:malonyl-[acyl-carrier protein] O-methyltransferase BioC [Xanthomonadaceae bacterium]